MKNRLLYIAGFATILATSTNGGVARVEANETTAAKGTYQQEYDRLWSYYNSDAFKQAYQDSYIQALKARGLYTNQGARQGIPKAVNAPIQASVNTQVQFIPPVRQATSVPMLQAYSKPTQVSAFAAYQQGGPYGQAISARTARQFSQHHLTTQQHLSKGASQVNGQTAGHYSINADQGHGSNPQPLAGTYDADYASQPIIEIPADQEVFLEVVAEVQPEQNPVRQALPSAEQEVRGIGYVSAKLGLGRLPTDTYVDSSGDHLKLEHKDSFSGSLAAGLYLNDLKSMFPSGFRTELEVAMLQAAVKSASGTAAAATIGGTPAIPANPPLPAVPAIPGITTPPPAPTGNRTLLAGMVNIAYDMDTGTRLTPYLGIGAGISKVSGDDYVYTNLSIKTDGNFALTAQAFGGLKYRLSDRLTFDLGARYLNAHNAIQSSNDSEVIETSASVFEGNAGMSIHF
ncbi:MAG: outer membrane protein [Alphaproteobacteria bacterium]